MQSGNCNCANNEEQLHFTTVVWARRAKLLPTMKVEEAEHCVRSPNDGCKGDFVQPVSMEGRGFESGMEESGNTGPIHVALKQSPSFGEW